MTPADYSKMDCSVARSLEAIGDRWSMLILRDAFYGVRRFEDFRADLGVARNILTDRLQRMVSQGLFDRVQYEDKPPRYEYRLTEKGKDLLPVMLTMMKWGDKWGPGDPPVTLTHITCGHETQPVVVCSHCGDELKRRDLRVHPITVRGVSGSADLANA